MRIFKIPVTYEVHGTVDIEANTLEEAMKYANDNIDDLPLVEAPEYVDGSYEINDFDMAKFINGIE